MKLPPALISILFVALGFVGAVRAGSASPSSFNSPLVFKGMQWQVKSSVGPVFLARLEGNTWRVLAVFDGTKGNYHLNWESPASGVYSAVDSAGTYSDSVKIRDGRPEGGRTAEVVAARTENSLGINPRELSEFHRLMLVSMVERPAARK